MVKWLLFAYVLVATAQAGDLKSYRLGPGKSLKVEPKVVRTPLEDKVLFNCDNYLFTDKDVRFALKYARQVSPNYYRDETVSIGCYGGAEVVFWNGDVASLTLDPQGRISATLMKKDRPDEYLYYICKRCGNSKTFARAPKPPK
jgi:hypothetical protein